MPLRPMEGGGTGTRVVRVLQCVAEMSEEFTVTALAKRLGLAPSTVHRLLQSLVQMGMIERAGIESYRPGRELFRMASLLVQRFDVRAIARPILRDLWTQWQETCSVCLYESVGRTGKVIDMIPSAHPLQYVIPPSVTISLAWGSLGRSILAFLPDEDINAVIAKAERGPLSGRKALPRAELLGELGKIRRHGYARFEDRATLKIAGIAAPIFGGQGSVLGSIGVTMPLTRFKSGNTKLLTEAVLAAASRASSAVGGDRQRADQKLRRKVTAHSRGAAGSPITVCEELRLSKEP